MVFTILMGLIASSLAFFLSRGPAPPLVQSAHALRAQKCIAELLLRMRNRARFAPASCCMQDEALN